jgi:hypothetical protein
MQVPREERPPFVVEVQEGVILRDYKAVLTELREAGEARKKLSDSSLLFKVADIRARAIAAMIYARLRIKDIAKLLGRSEAQIYRDINNAGAGTAASTKEAPVAEKT